MGDALNSTAGDDARFCRMIARGGELDGERVLTSETVEAMSANALEAFERSVDASIVS